MAELLGKQFSDCRPRVSEAPADGMAMYTPDPQWDVPIVLPAAKTTGHSSFQTRMLNIQPKGFVCTGNAAQQVFNTPWQLSLVGSGEKYYLLLTIQGRKVKKIWLQVTQVTVKYVLFETPFPQTAPHPPPPTLSAV